MLSKGFKYIRLLKKKIKRSLIHNRKPICALQMASLPLNEYQQRIWFLQLKPLLLFLFTFLQLIFLRLLPHLLPPPPKAVSASKFISRNHENSYGLAAWFLFLSFFLFVRESKITGNLAQRIKLLLNIRCTWQWVRWLAFASCGQPMYWIVVIQQLWWEICWNHR